MTKFNLILEFIKHYRMNDHFLNQAITELKLGLLLSEYLDPDPMSKFEPIKEIKDGLLSPDCNVQMQAVDKLLEHMDSEHRSPEKAREVLDYLVPIYLEKKATEKDKRRCELLLELKKLDSEESNKE